MEFCIGVVLVLGHSIVKKVSKVVYHFLFFHKGIQTHCQIHFFCSI